ncbi:CaiB/BaiF CoA transferase family protein [Bradyrhizobium septentrionale]|uniref:CoA transferase n=1 Tax=Bradyrhizobium septentrionale TaxID=1404411 RepID=A0A973VT15_9BRAD|nr:CoA transferase [Bradyrhizobium septentrionale]UGY18967.1 CoA transferase [Bradyrhizobium septentrionale]UGY27693.1 CoA transferase [Bradyrhizobium septentrionale]
MRSSDREPLSGIRVLDLCRVVSGPFATMQLGDLGADIVKIEDPRQGDESRRYGPPFIGSESAYFLSVNRNKRSCAIDLKSPAGRDAALELASVADVVIENFRPGTLDKWGLGFDALRARKGDIILCSISGFGRTGADALRPGYDLILQGESGVMDITGDPDGPPTKVGTSIADLVTGLYASQSVLAALMRKSRTGEGGRVDVSMLDAMASLLTFNAGMYFASGESPKRRGNVHPTISPYEPFETSDGWINVGVANDKFWTAFCDVIGRPDLIEDVSFATAPKRAASRNELVAILSPLFARRTRADWLQSLGAAGIPCGAIKSVGEVCETPQLTQRGMVQTVSHPAAGDVKFIARPARFGDEPPAPSTPPPMLGEHTSEVLAEWLGWTDDRLERFAVEGAFGEFGRNFVRSPRKASS